MCVSRYLLIVYLLHVLLLKGLVYYCNFTQQVNTDKTNQTKQIIGNGDLPQNIFLLLTDTTSILARLFHSLYILIAFYLDIYAASSLPTRWVSFIYRCASSYYGVCHLLAYWKLFSSLFYFWTGELGTAIHGIRI